MSNTSWRIGPIRVSSNSSWFLTALDISQGFVSKWMIGLEMNCCGSNLPRHIRSENARKAAATRAAMAGLNISMEDPDTGRGQGKGPPEKHFMHFKAASEHIHWWCHVFSWHISNHFHLHSGRHHGKLTSIFSRTNQICQESGYSQTKQMNIPTAALQKCWVDDPCSSARAAQVVWSPVQSPGSYVLDPRCPALCPFCRKPPDLWVKISHFSLVFPGIHWTYLPKRVALSSLGVRADGGAEESRQVGNAGSGCVVLDGQTGAPHTTSGWNQSWSLISVNRSRVGQASAQT